MNDTSYNNKAVWYLKLILFLVIILNCFEEEKQKGLTYSPKSKLLYATLQNLNKTGEDLAANLDKNTRDKFGIMGEKENLYIKAKIKTGSNFCDTDITDKGIFINNKIGKVITVQIPLSVYFSLSEIKSIDYIEIDSPLNLRD